MSELQVSAALLRSRIVSRTARERDVHFESGLGTKPATQAYERQSASVAAHRALQKARRQRPTPEVRLKAIGRRRNWAGGGNMPPGIRTSYSEAERAVLAVIAEQCRRNGYCNLCVDEIARLAGVGRTSVQNAIRKARSKERAHISVRERPQAGGKNLTNIIKIICRSWLGWIGRAIGFKRLSTSETEVKISPLMGVETAKTAFQMVCVAAARDPIKRPHPVEKHSSTWSPAPRWLHGFRGLVNG